jgi:hypothetical protein
LPSPRGPNVNIFSIIVARFLTVSRMLVQTGILMTTCFSLDPQDTIFSQQPGCTTSTSTVTDRIVCNSTLRVLEYSHLSNRPPEMPPYSLAPLSALSISRGSRFLVRVVATGRAALISCIETSETSNAVSVNAEFKIKEIFSVGTECT